MTDQSTNQIPNKMPEEEAKVSMSDDQAVISRANTDDLEKKANENFAGWQRALADYQNLKKEWEKKQFSFMNEAKKIFLAEFLPIYDNLKKAVNTPSDQSNGLEWRNGIEQIKEQCDLLIRRWNVEPVATVGENFNPELHEALEHQNDGQTVTQELQGGYLVDGQLLYPAKVVVGSPDDAVPAEEQISDTVNN